MYNSTEILLACQQFKQLYEKVIVEVAEEYGMSKIEIDILLFLHNNPSFDSAKDVVELKGIAKSYVSKTVERLIKKEMVTALVDKKDRRVIHLKINKKAKSIIDEAVVAQKNYLKLIYKDVTIEEKEELKIIMEKIVLNVKEEL